jgi:hypothetical protein
MRGLRRRVRQTIEVSTGGERHTFERFECAVHALAPTAGQCGCRILGYGVEAGGAFYCGAHCAHRAGVEAAQDRV